MNSSQLPQSTTEPPLAVVALSFVMILVQVQAATHGGVQDPVPIVTAA